MHRVRSALTPLLAVVLLASASTASAQTIDDLEKRMDCSDFVPAATEPLPSSERIVVRVAVVLHDIDLATARETLANAQRAYAPLNIQLEPTYLYAYVPEREVEAVFAKLKSLFGGKRPAWAHAVLLLSAEDFPPQTTGGIDPAGVADCVGGITKPEESFAIAEVSENDNADEAEVVAHEVGHLFGAHHHYANCAMGSREQGTYEDVCTTMFNDVLLQSLTFGPLEASTIRAYAESFVDPLTVAPPADGTALTPIPASTRLAPDVCANPVFTDPVDDVATWPGLESDEADVIEARYVFRAGRPWFRIEVKAADGQFEGADGVEWTLGFTAAKAKKTLVAQWDGNAAPTAVLTDVASGATTPVAGGRVLEGAPGIVEIPWPLALDTKLVFETFRGRIGPLVKTPELLFHTDNADPAIERGRLADCASARPADGTKTTGKPPAGSGGHDHASLPGRHPTGTAAGASERGTAASRRAARSRGARRFVLADRSARRASRARRLTFRVTGAAGRVALRLLDRRGRVVGRGVRRGTTAIVKLRRAVKPGRYTLVAGARRVTVTLR